MKKIIGLFFVAVIVIFLIMRGGNHSSKDSANDTWPESGLASVLPKPDAKKINIGYDLEDSFSASIKNASKEDFSAYVAKCENSGFTIDVVHDSNEYSAYNADGYQVNISYYSSSEYVSITLQAPKINGTIDWPTIGLATLVPTPNTNIGTISTDSSSQFNAWVGETPFDDYQAYVNLCIENGFNIDYNNHEKVFIANNANGVSLRLEYQGFNTMYIALYAPDDFENESNNTNDLSDAETVEGEENNADDATISTTPSVDNTELIDGMRPEFKAALDSYEAFFDEYCEFMKKYAANPNDLELISEYSNYMSLYADTMSKMSALDDGNMNDAETRYYIEVTTRVSQKLLEASGSIG